MAASTLPQIGLTAEWLGTQAGGLETYARSLIGGLARHVPEFRYTAYTTRPDELKALARDCPSLTPRYLGVRGRLPAMGVALPAALLRQPPALLHVTSIPPLFSPVPIVMTVHDLGYRLIPDMFPPRVRWRLDRTISAGIRRSTRIIAVSEATREDLCAHYPVDPGRVSVVPEAGLTHKTPAENPQEEAALRAQYGLGQGYFLYIGRLHVRKNLLSLLDAFAQLPETTRQTCGLVLVGRRLYGGGELSERIAGLGIGDSVTFTGHIPDAHLVGLYRGALAFVYPSLFEGFGLPPLEAMSMGVPVIASDRHSLPEVVGDAGILVDASAAQNLAQAMQTMFQNPALRADLRRRGLERAAQFTWCRTAEMTAEIYREVLEEQSLRRQKAIGPASM